jgi:hypothetical protein
MTDDFNADPRWSNEGPGTEVGALTTTNVEAVTRTHADDGLAGTEAKTGTEAVEDHDPSMSSGSVYLASWPLNSSKLDPLESYASVHSVESEWRVDYVARRGVRTTHSLFKNVNLSIMGFRQYLEQLREPSTLDQSTESYLTRHKKK